MDIKEIASLANMQLKSLVTSWLPGGYFNGSEYKVLNPRRPDKSIGSFNINISSGQWSDFACGDAGGDAVSLFAYINNISQGDAMREVAQIINYNEPLKTETYKKPRAEPVSMIYPAGKNAPPPPQKKLTKINGKWIEYPITHLWEYRSPIGERLGYVTRYETPEGKETPPLTLWKYSDGSIKWRFKSFPDPRPIYGLDRLSARQDASVIIVEGEKCKDTLESVFDSAGISEKIVVVAWCGGSKAIKKTDWTPLKNRKIVLWPDFDLQKDKNGVQLPFNKQPGVCAMLNISKRVSGQIKLINQKDGFPASWDVADAILNDGWDVKKILDFIHKNAVEIESNHVPEDEPPPPQEIYNEPETTFEPMSINSADPDSPRMLGHRDGKYYYMPARTLRVYALKPMEHSQGGFRGLAPLSYFQRNFPGAKGVSWDSAADFIMRACEDVGIYSDKNHRGRGAWFDDGRAVLHLGNKIISDGEEYSIQDFKTRYIYQQDEPLADVSVAHPLKKTDAFKLREIMDWLQWEKPISGVFLSGWCAIAPICGALSYRPHVWLTGSAGTGKSMVLDNIIKKILGGFALAATSESTGNGIRQDLRDDAKCVVFDEFDADNIQDIGRVQRVLELSRQAFSDSNAAIIKGTSSGIAQRFYIRSCFLLSSIAVNLSRQADKTRVMVLSLLKPRDRDGMTQGEHYKKLCEMVSDTITDKWCSSFRARSIKMIPIIRKNAEVFTGAIAEKLGNRRAGDQAGPLLAGAYSLSSDALITPEQAADWVEKQDWSEQKTLSEESDESKCLSDIMQSLIRVSGSIDISVAEAIKDHEEGFSDVADLALKRHGIKYDRDERMIYISDTHSGLKKILANSPFVKSYGRVLKRIPGAIDAPQMRFTGHRSRATGIEYNYVFDG